MNCYLYEDERLVFEGEGWGIIVDDGAAKRTYCEGYVYGTHQECTDPWLGVAGDNEKSAKEDQEGYYSYGENCWEPYSTDSNSRKDFKKGPAVCCLCDNVVPEGIQALILMEAWNRR